MKAFFKLLMIVVVVAPLMACQQKDSKRGQIRPRGARGAPAIHGTQNPYGYNGLPQAGFTSPGVPGAPTSGRTWGAVHGGYNRISDYEFDARVHDFVAATMDPAQLGSVSGQLAASTGIRFWAHVEPVGTRFNPAGMGTVNISSANSEFRMVIWDSFAGQIDATGELIPEYPVHIRGGAVGQIQGNQADIYFQDQYGWIRIYGTFDAQYFYGRVYFDNIRNLDGSSGYANDMGDFYIATCSFFKCN